MMPLTDRQRQVYDFIGSFTNENGYPPSIREIGSAIGSKYTANARLHVDALCKKGFITRVPGLARSLRIVKEAKAS